MLNNPISPLIRNVRRTTSGAPILIIVEQPEGLIADAGQVVRFKIVARGAKTYQWIRAGEPLNGENSDVLEFVAEDRLDETFYTCVISDGDSEIESDAAFLMISGDFRVPDVVASYGVRQPDGYGGKKIVGKDLQAIEIDGALEGNPDKFEVDGLEIKAIEPITERTVLVCTGSNGLGLLSNFKVTFNPFDGYSIRADDEELRTVLDLLDIDTSGPTLIRVRDGEFASWSDSLRGKRFKGKVTIEADTPRVGWKCFTKISEKIEINGIDNLTLRHLEIYDPTIERSYVEIIETKNSPINLTLDGLHVHGKKYDPHQDFTNGGYANGSAIGTADKNYPVDMVVKNCLFEDIYSVGPGGKVSSFTFLNNEVRYIYSDGLFITDGGGDFPEIIIHWNRIHSLLSRPSDKGNPHPDPIQVYHTHKGDWPGISIKYNELGGGDTRGRAAQPIFMTNAKEASESFFDDPDISGNLIFTDQSVHCISCFNVRDGRCNNNTIAKVDPSDDSVTFTTAIKFGTGRTEGVQRICGNVAEGISVPSGDAVMKGNVLMGHKGSLLSYEECFVGPEWNKRLSYQERLDAYAVKPGGPLEGLGATAAGYITRGKLGESGTVNTDFEVWK